MATESPDTSAAIWNEPLETLLSRLDARFDGLKNDEAASRGQRYGLNLLKPRPRQAALRQFMSRFRNPLVILLIAAGVISALTGDRTSFVIITVMVIGSVTLDFFQEYRAEKAADELRKRQDRQRLSHGLSR